MADAKYSTPDVDIIYGNTFGVHTLSTLQDGAGNNITSYIKDSGVVALDVRDANVHTEKRTACFISTQQLRLR